TLFLRKIYFPSISSSILFTFFDDYYSALSYNIWRVSEVYNRRERAGTCLLYPPSLQGEEDGASVIEES
ncbi:MAG: hypothetical protein K8R19_11480, partial [Methanosarcinales archaeon]|nr:hypothetical protein [Methanosarcinales archaeon]